MNNKRVDRLAKSGSPEERIKQLFDGYFDRLFFFAKSIVKTEEAAQDVVSEVFLACWKAIDNLKNVKDIRAYLYTCTRNESLRFLKKQHQSTHPIEDAEGNTPFLLAIDSHTPESALLFEELQDVVERSLQRMPKQCQMVYKLVREDGLSHQEVAKVMEISPNTVKNHMVRAIKFMREALEAYIYENKEVKPSNAKIISLGYCLIIILSPNIFDFFLD